MKEQFQVSGLFYEVNDYKFRMVLNIRLKDSNIKAPDLMVVMMNPGKSKPVNGRDNSKTESKALSDATQTQIMQVMLNCGFKYARILNLSDVRESNSSKFYDLIKELDEQQIAHSIFDNRRTSDFEAYFIENVPIILAWGVDASLTHLAESAISCIPQQNRFGLKKEGFDTAFYHPLPPSYYKQKKWVERICEQIKTARFRRNNLI